jgi:hypothetical protein
MPSVGYPERVACGSPSRPAVVGRIMFAMNGRVAVVVVAVIVLCECRFATRVCAQSFGGCDCSAPVQPRSPAQLDQERAALITDLNGMHDKRDEILRQFAKHALRQAEIALIQKGPLLRKLEAVAKLLIIRRNGAAALLRGDVVAVEQHAKEEKECLETIERIDSELSGFASEVAQLEQEKVQLQAEAEQLRFEWIEKLSVVNRDEFVRERLTLLDAELAADPGFADGFLYRSLLQMQSGDSTAARKDIREARERMYGTTTTLKEKFRSEFKPAQIVDMVYASLLLGQEKPAWNYVEICRQRFPQFINHPVYLHMKAKYEEYENSYSTASDLYHEAIRKVEGGADRPPHDTYNVEELYADAAWFYAAVPAPTSRDPKEAQRCAELALKKTNCKSWTAWRAIAALKAAERDWKTALLAMERCELHAPQHLGDELEEQVLAYKNEKPFWMKRHKRE